MSYYIAFMFCMFITDRYWLLETQLLLVVRCNFFVRFIVTDVYELAGSAHRAI